MNAYFCASTFCFPLPKPLPLPLVLVLPASLIATGGLGFPVFLFEDARRILSFPLSLLLRDFFFNFFFSLFLRRSLLRSLSSLLAEEQKKNRRRNLNAQRERRMPLFLNQTRSTNKLKNDSRTTEQPTGRICPVLCLYHPHVVVVVVVKERAKPNERDDPFFSPRRSNGDFSR